MKHTKHTGHIPLAALCAWIATVGGDMTSEAAVRSGSSFTYLRRLFLKGSEAAADQAARRAVDHGAGSEEYELTTAADLYWDMMGFTYRGRKNPVTVRFMWLDPVTSAQHYETYVDKKLVDRHPFQYELHNRWYRCTSDGDPNNSYDFVLFATTRFRVTDRVVKSSPGDEVFHHPFDFEIGLKPLPAECRTPMALVMARETGSAIVARGGSIRVEPSAHNADIEYFIAGYDPVP